MSLCQPNITCLSQSKCTPKSEILHDPYFGLYYYRRRAILIEFLASVISNPEIVNICDFGCGDGWYLKYLSENHNGKQWYGVDLSEAMIARAKKECPSAELLLSGNGIGFNCEFDLIPKFRPMRSIYQ